MVLECVTCKEYYSERFLKNSPTLNVFVLTIFASEHDPHKGYMNKIK